MCHRSVLLPYPVDVDMTDNQMNVPGGSLVRERLPRVAGSLGLVCIAAGYGMELVRQRGTCDTGDPSPDTLVASVLLIFVGGIVLGLGGLCVSVYRSLSSHHPRTLDIIMCVASVLGGTSIFLFAESGPGGWFQYCGT